MDSTGIRDDRLIHVHLPIAEDVSGMVVLPNDESNAGGIWLKFDH